MSLFQPSVLNKYLKLQDKEVTAKAYNRFIKHFHNHAIQENIKDSKEEEYQGIFLTDLFVNILGYTMKPQPNYNLVAEQKNQTNSKKSDGAILKDDAAIAVIELKGTKTKDLKSITEQAFGYKANQKGCVYVITSNYEKLRFYVNDATEHLEFNLFSLTESDFELMYLCISKDAILLDVPQRIKNESLVKEEQITKDFYKDYSLFKRELYRDLVKLNAKKLKAPKQTELAEASLEDQELQKELQRLEKNVKLALFKKSQKLIDRFLFIFFAEDRGLLPPNSTVKILKDWDKLKEMDAIMPLYDRFKLYFNYLDTGRSGTDKKAEIYAYNGGLFKPDSILDQIDISDSLLYRHTLKLSNYDFDSQVDVNILGHIFENSLNEIESVNAEIEGEEFDKQKSKRKKDGVFYTPKYITKYIVENTVGKLCEEKKTELAFNEAEYYKSRKGRHDSTLKKLLKQLEEYRQWLLQLTICDPACGSGAFLNQALDFLIKEHTYIDELKTNLLGGSIVLSDIENTILENNIFGVDLNEESVEIAKLSLWLRTAKPRRKLNNLNKNIKCGNSLIDNKSIAGEKAFNWVEQFPKVFKKGGFDVIIGNPPYVRQELFKEIKPYLKKHYNCYNSVADLYTYFIEKGINLMNDKGLFSYILPNKFLKATYGKEIRKVIQEESYLELLLDFDDYPVFADATTYPIIFVLNKSNKKDTFLYSKISKRDSSKEPIATLNSKMKEIYSSSITKGLWNFIPKKEFKLFEKLHLQNISLEEYVNKKVFLGLKTGKNDAFIVNRQTIENIISKDPLSKKIIKKVATGKEVYRYRLVNSEKYMLFTEYDVNVPEIYPGVFEWLKKFENDLKKRGDKGKDWWNLRPCDYYHEIQQPKIIWRSITNECGFYLDRDGELLLTNNNYFIANSTKGLIAVLNSKVSFFILKNICTSLQGGYFDFRRDKVLTLPIPSDLHLKEETFEVKVNEIQDMNIKKSNLVYSFKFYILQGFSAIQLSKKLQDWHELEFGEFIKELSKAIKVANKERVKHNESLIETLTKSDEMEWMELFNNKKKQVQELETKISQTDKEIDQLVYELYELTPEEITIIENS